MDATLYKGPLFVTIGYFILYFIFILNILRVRLRLHKEFRAKGEKFDRYFSQSREMLAADRIQLNMLEHMPFFLTLMWLNAVFVSIEVSTALGAIYTLSRAAYPFLLKGRLGRDIPRRLLLSTFTGYAITFYFALSLILKVI